MYIFKTILPLFPNTLLAAALYPLLHFPETPQGHEPLFLVGIYYTPWVFESIMKGRESQPQNILFYKSIRQSPRTALSARGPPRPPLPT